MLMSSLMVLVWYLMLNCSTKYQNLGVTKDADEKNKISDVDVMKELVVFIKTHQEMQSYVKIEQVPNLEIN